MFYIFRSYRMDRRSLLSHLFENDIWIQSDRAIQTLTQYIQDTSQFLPHDIGQIISKLVYRARDKWQKANRTKTVFLKQNESWLDEPVVKFTALPVVPKKGGRPSVEFVEASRRTKRIEGWKGLWLTTPQTRFYMPPVRNCNAKTIMWCRWRWKN